MIVCDVDSIYCTAWDKTCPHCRHRRTWCVIHNQPTAENRCLCALVEAKVNEIMDKHLTPLERRGKLHISTIDAVANDVIALLITQRRAVVREVEAAYHK